MEFAVILSRAIRMCDDKRQEESTRGDRLANYYGISMVVCHDVTVSIGSFLTIHFFLYSNYFTGDRENTKRQ